MAIIQHHQHVLHTSSTCTACPYTTVEDVTRVVHTQSCSTTALGQFPSYTDELASGQVPTNLQGRIQ